MQSLDTGLFLIKGVERRLHLCRYIAYESGLQLVMFICHNYGFLLFAGKRNVTQQDYGTENKCCHKNGERYAQCYDNGLARSYGTLLFIYLFKCTVIFCLQFGKLFI